MLLSDRDIQAEIDAGRVALDPFDPEMVQPSSVDVRLDRFFRLFDNHKYPHIDPAAGAARADPPGRAARATSRSSCTRASSCSARRTRSSRCPTTSPPASRASPRSAGSACSRTRPRASSTRASRGHVTLELSNVATLPIKLWPGMKIGQLCFFRLSSPAEHPYGSAKYGSRYQGQRGPTPSQSFLNFHRTDI